MTQDYLKKELNALTTPLSEETVRCLYALKPAVARKLIRNGTAANYDRQTREGINTAFNHLPPIADFSIASTNASGASLDGITPQPPAAAAENRRRSSLRKASQIDRNLYANRKSVPRFEHQQAKIGNRISRQYDSHLNKFYSDLDHIEHVARGDRNLNTEYSAAGSAFPKFREVHDLEDDFMAAMENTLPPLDDLHLHDHQYQMAQLKATGQGQGQGQADGPADRSMAQGSNVNSRHNSDSFETSHSIVRSRYSMAPGVSILEEKGEKSGLEGEKGGKGNSTRQGEEYTTYTTTDESTVDATSWLTKGPLEDMLITKMSRAEKSVTASAKPSEAQDKKTQGEKEQSKLPPAVDRGEIFPSKYRDIGWSKEMGQMMQSIRPTSYIDEFRHPQNATRNDWSKLVHVNGFIKNPEQNDLQTFEDNKRHRIKEARHEYNQRIKPQMRKEVRRKKILDHIRQKLPKGEFEAKEDQLDVDCESMSSHSSEDNSLHSGESFRQLLDDIPLRDPTDKDYMFVANQTLPREEIEEKLLRMQQRPTADTIHQASQEISEAVQKKRLGRRLLKQRIDNLAGFDDVRARFSVDREPDVNHVITFSKNRTRNPDIEKAKAEMSRDESRAAEIAERVDLGPELIERINRKLEAAGLPKWDDLGYREPEEPASLFMTKDARPMETLVEYRKIDNIGLLHKPFLVDYQKDKVTGETIAMPWYQVDTQNCPKEVLDRFDRLTSTGQFNRGGQKFVSAGHHMQKQVYHQMSNKNFLENTFCDYMQPAGTIECGGKKDYFDQFYDVMHDNSWEHGTTPDDNKKFQKLQSPGTKPTVQEDDKTRGDISKIQTEEEGEEEKGDQFETFGQVVKGHKIVDEKQRRRSSVRRQSEDTVTFGSV